MEANNQMLIQSSLSNYVATELSFASDFGKKHNTELLSDWSCCRGSWETSRNCDQQRNCNFTSEEGNKISCSEVVEISRTNSDISVVEDTSASSASKWNGFVYRRRKMHTDASVADDMCASCVSRWNGFVYKRRKMHPDISAVDDMCASCVSKWNGYVYNRRNKVNVLDCDKGIEIDSSHFRQSLYVRNPTNSRLLHAENSIAIPCSQIFERKNPVPLLKSSQYDRHLGTEVALPAKSSECYSRIKDSCSSSKPDTGNADVTVLEEFTSAREFCIFFLNKHGLLSGESTSSVHNTSALLCINDSNIFQSCKICCTLENPWKMLICDLCEEAFHVSCCQPKVTDLPVDNWYCHPCFRKRPKALRERSSGKKASILSELRCQKSGGKGGPIFCMLRDDRPYTSAVRMGKDFQAEVSEWDGPISEDLNCYDAHLQMDPVAYPCLNVQNVKNQSKSSSFGNWIQCRQVIYKSSKDKGNVCGKWRRAPLFVVQTNDWDCSCCVLWDPIHADCAVPQELETKVILKHLEYVEMLRPRMNMLIIGETETKTSRNCNKDIEAREEDHIIIRSHEQ